MPGPVPSFMQTSIDAVSLQRAAVMSFVTVIIIALVLVSDE